MADVDLNDVASKGIQDLQDSIDKLNGLMNQPGADIPGIATQIEALQAKQTDLRDMALGTIQATEADRDAIAAVTAAAVSLSKEASKIKDAASALTTAIKVVSAAGSLVTALAGFA